MILLVAEMQNLKANPIASGDRHRARSATRSWTRSGGNRAGAQRNAARRRLLHLRAGVRQSSRHVRRSRQQVREAEPSMPVEVIGLDALPEVGDNFQVVTDTAKAKQIVIYRESKAREQAMPRAAASRSSSCTSSCQGRRRQGAQHHHQDGRRRHGRSSERHAAEAVDRQGEDPRDREGVGAITESDVLLASASNAIIIGFNVRPERNAASLAEKEKVDIRLHTIIYELTDEIKTRHDRHARAGVQGSLSRAGPRVREVFRITKVGNVAGCYVTEGIDQPRAVRCGCCATTS